MLDRAPERFFIPEMLFPSPARRRGGPVQLTFRTSYESGFNAPLPTDFYVEAFGEATSFAEAQVRFINTAYEIAGIISFVTNTDLGQLELEIAFDCTEGLSDHEFVQRLVPTLPVLAVPSRPIEPDNVVAFINTIDENPERERIQRAIAQYAEALRKWNVGHEIMCVAHLYMGIEAITKSFLRLEAAKTGLDNNALAQSWDIDIKQLDSEVRRRIILAILPITNPTLAIAFQG